MRRGAEDLRSHPSSIHHPGGSLSQRTCKRTQAPDPRKPCGLSAVEIERLFLFDTNYTTGATPTKASEVQIDLARRQLLGNTFAVASVAWLLWGWLKHLGVAGGVLRPEHLLATSVARKLGGGRIPPKSYGIRG